MNTLCIPKEIPKGSFCDLTADAIARINEFLQNPTFFLETNNRPEISQIRGCIRPKSPSFVFENESKPKPENSETSHSFWIRFRFEFET